MCGLSFSVGSITRKRRHFQEMGIDVLKRVNINKAFLSAGGVDEQHGITCSHFHEVPIKQMAMQRAVEKHLVVDKSKYGKVRAARFAGMSDFTSIVSG